MKRALFFLVALLTGCFASGQKEANPGMNELKEKVIGWDKIMPPNGNAPGRSTAIQGRTYTAYQIGLIDTFTNWIKKSYVPIGGLPQPERLALPDSRENTLYLPKGTGVAMALWVPCYDASGKKIIRAQPASRSYIVILTNHLKGLEAAYDFNTPTQYYFTMHYNTRGRLVNEEDAQKDDPYVNEIRSRIGDHFIYFTGKLVNILLMPGRELPVQQVSKGEVLEKGEEAVRRVYPDPAANRKLLDKINSLREKYRNRLQEPAFVHSVQLSVSSFTGDFDLFEPMVNTRYMFPVYKIKPAVYELSKQDKPQWVHISFPYATEKNTTVDWEIFRAMTSNFNYQYVYDFFFDPEKVKGKPYQPRQVVTQSEAERRIDARDNKSKQARAFPEGVHFMEDFADAQSGSMPAGWTSRQNNRGFAIETLPGENGKWLQLDSGSDIIPSSMKKPLPANFTLEFDLACTGYSNRTGRTVTVNFTGPNVAASLSVTPGNEQNIRIYPSMANFRVSAGSGGPGYHSIEFSSYSNKKTRVHVKIVRSGTSLIAYVNGTKVESDPKYKQDYEKEMSVGTHASFNKLEWTSDTVSTNPPEDKGKVYISNIKITKD